jgi:hypothetical protein
MYFKEIKRITIRRADNRGRDGYKACTFSATQKLVLWVQVSLHLWMFKHVLYVQLSCVHRLEVRMWVNQSKVKVKASHNTHMEAQGGEDV